jgi:hypothetical protein
MTRAFGPKWGPDGPEMRIFYSNFTVFRAIERGIIVHPGTLEPQTHQTSDIIGHYWQ